MNAADLGLSDSTSGTLIARVRTGQPEAWRRLVRLYGALAYRWARQAGLQDCDAADVVQEVFRAVAANIANFRQDANSTFRGWLWTITRNQVRLFYRRRSGGAVAVGGDDALTQLQQYPALLDQDDEPADIDSRAMLINRALKLIQGDFQAQTWQAFCEVAIEGRSPSDTAQALGMSVTAVRQAKYRVLCRLREELDGL